MTYNSNIHHRHSIRLKGYDYSQAGLYFVTICCQDRLCRFGKIRKGEPLRSPEMVLNEFGEIACHEWIKLPERYPKISLDVFQIMPNHFHGIIALNDVGATLAVAPNNATVAPNNMVAPNNAITQNNAVAIDNAVIQNNAITIDNTIAIKGAGASPAPTVTATVGNIVGAYKSLVMNKCLEICKSKNEYMGKFWQRNYYEHIIRNEKSYQNISDYIINNPAKWREDTFYQQEN
jgi:REP element-mobilizing transposase RayT